MVGADIRLIAPSEYAKLGSETVCEQLAEELRDQGRNPYVIPLGGSNAIGAFGYLQCVEEIIDSGITLRPCWVCSQASASCPTCDTLAVHGGLHGLDEVEVVVADALGELGGDLAVIHQLSSPLDDEQGNSNIVYTSASCGIIQRESAKP